MREIRTSGLMSGDGKRSDVAWPQATAPVLDSTQDKCQAPARFLSESALPRSRPHRAVRREAQALQAHCSPMRKNCPELRFLRRSRPYVHPRQIRPQDLDRLEYHLLADPGTNVGKHLDR